jgi:hypothetical protein
VCTKWVRYCRDEAGAAFLHFREWQGDRPKPVRYRPNSEMPFRRSGNPHRRIAVVSRLLTFGRRNVVSRWEHDRMTEPISIIGIDTDHVGHPRNDGTPGSGLYSVPITLSRSVSAREAALLVHFWDNPNSWSTMHRPGIGRVFGSTFVLDGTTLEEVRDVHVTTIKSAVNATNAEYAHELAREERRREAELAQRTSRDEEVHRIATEIRFD